MASRFLKRRAQTPSTAGSTTLPNAASTRCSHGYTPRPRLRAAPQVHHAVRVLRDAGAHRLSVRHHPEGLLSPAGYRPDHRHLRGRAGRLLRRDAEAQEAVGEVIATDPAVATVAMAIGAGGPTAALQQRPHLHHIEAQGRARRRRSTRSSRGSGRSSTRSRASGCSCRPRRTSTSAAAPSRTQFQYTLQDGDLDELNDWSPKILEQAQGAARAARRRHRPAVRWPRLEPRPSIAIRPRATASARS